MWLLVVLLLSGQEGVEVAELFVELYFVVEFSLSDAMVVELILKESDVVVE